MYKLGLIGRKLGHSWSQKWFEAMFRREGISDASYHLYELESIDRIREWAADQRLNGFNVTIPYKESILPYLDEADAVVQAIGAANCIEVRGNRLIGHNTDAPAFCEALSPLLNAIQASTIAPPQALVLGTGGASRAVCYALKKLGIAHLLVSRTPERHSNSISYAQAEEMAATHTLIINTTPVGMWPKTDESPWTKFDAITPKSLCYDLIYNPEETLFLSLAKQHGALTQNGLAMLYRQAELSWEYWK